LIDAFKDTNKTAVILGGAECVYRDYDLVKDTSLVHFGVNDISFQFSKAPVDHVVSLHSDMVGSLKRLNQIRYTHTCTSHGYKSDDGVDVSWYNHINNIGGTSSLFAVEIAIKLGFRRILVCGVPLDGTPHYYEDLRNIESELYKFGRLSEAAIWKQTIDNYRESIDLDIKVASGKLKDIFGGF
jgi:hypothetical protein